MTFHGIFWIKLYFLYSLINFTCKKSWILTVVFKDNYGFCVQYPHECRPWTKLRDDSLFDSTVSLNEQVMTIWTLINWYSVLGLLEGDWNPNALSFFNSQMGWTWSFLYYSLIPFWMQSMRTALLFLLLQPPRCSVSQHS